MNFGVRAERARFIRAWAGAAPVRWEALLEETERLMTLAALRRVPKRRLRGIIRAGLYKILTVTDSASKKS
jgi:hypothetical protein